MGTCIVGTGCFLPERAVTNEMLAEILTKWPPKKIKKFLGIDTRHILCDYDVESGEAVLPETGPKCGVDMGLLAARDALEQANIQPSQVTRLLLTSGTPDHNSYSMDVQRMKQELGLDVGTKVLQTNKACDGALAMISLADDLLRGNQEEVILVVAVNFASAYLNNRVYADLRGQLPAYIFGDGAGAVVMRWVEGKPGVVASHNGSFHKEDFVSCAGGGALYPPYATRTDPTHMATVVHGQQTAQLAPPLIAECVTTVLQAGGKVPTDVARFYLHQINGLLVTAVANQLELPLDRVPIHASRYGNTAAASTLILLAEDVRDGVVTLGSGEFVCFASPGAGVEYHGHLISL